MIYVYFLLAFVLTVLIECTSMFLIFKSKQFVYYVFLCNLLTNPALNLIALGVEYIWGAFGYKLSIIILEIGVVIVEAYIIRLLCGFKTKKSILISTVLNSLSYGAGLMFFSMFIG
jgi:hypothetical protein